MLYGLGKPEIGMGFSDPYRLNFFNPKLHVQLACTKISLFHILGTWKKFVAEISSLVYHRTNFLRLSKCVFEKYI